MSEKYSLTVAGCKRELPICQVDEKTKIAVFIMFGDIELTVNSARELLKLCPEHDILITAEAKGIPLCYEMARENGKKYVVARKGVKVYMHNPVQVKVKSITTKRLQNLYLSESDFGLIMGKKVLIVDDVVSTGESLIAIETLVNKAGGEVVGKACVLAEGSAIDRGDIISLGYLPLFPV